MNEVTTCHALVAGGGLSGSASLEVSLQGDSPFTLSTVVYFKEVRRGDIFLWDGFFKLSLREGILYLFCLGAGQEEISRLELACISPDEWYTLTLLYNGTILSVYIRGRKAGTLPCSSLSGRAVASHLALGEGLAAYFRSLILLSVCLQHQEVELFCAGNDGWEEKCLTWFDFTQGGLTNRCAGSPMVMSTEGSVHIGTILMVERVKFILEKEQYGKDSRGLLHAASQNGQASCVGILRVGQAGKISGYLSLDTSWPAVWEVRGEVDVIWNEVIKPES